MINRGYTLLFAVFTATLVLGVAVFILSNSKKQYDLAVTARDSMYAFYAADSAAECAYVESGDDGLDVFESDGTTRKIDVHITCNSTQSSDAVFSYIPKENSGFDADFWFSLNVDQVKDILIPLGGSSCALVTVTYGTKNTISPGSFIVIDSNGYNQCDSSGPKKSTRTIERGVRLTVSN